MRPSQLLLAALLAAPQLACRSATPTVESPPRSPAERLAERVLERLGGAQAWERTRHLHWRFFGGRECHWDKHTGDVRLRSEELILLFNVVTREGRAFRSGEEVLDPSERRALLEQGYGWWVNDSYWVVMPYKLLDPGVRLRLVGEDTLADGRPSDVLELTFDAVGLTPDNRYLVEVGRDTDLVEEWTFFPDATAEARFTLPWAGWRRFGAIWLATDHGRDAEWDLAVWDELPREVYSVP